MTKALFAGLLASLVASLTLGPTHAAEAKKVSQPQAYLVLVGISDYADKQIKPRPHAEADAQALYDLFTNKDYLGVEPDHIRLLLGKADSQRPSEPATHDNILKALTWAADKAKRNDLVIFAFLGEGAPLGERVCYLASDSTFKDRAKNAVASPDIEHALAKLKSEKFCAFLDADFKGFDTGKDPAPDLNVQNFYLMKEFLGGEDDETPLVGRVVFLATRGLNPSLDLEKHDLFNTALLQGLQGAADKEGYGLDDEEGYEPDGLVTVDELVNYLDREIPSLSRKYGKTKEEKEQNFTPLEDQESHFVLTRNPAVRPQVEREIAKLNQLAKDQKISEELKDEGDGLLNRLPKLKAYRALRKKYEALASGKLDVDDFTKERQALLDDMKLSREAAQAYSVKVLEAAGIIVSQYVKDVDEGDLVGWGLKGLYQRLEVKMPPDIKKQVDQVHGKGERDLLQLLTEAREELGRREDLANHKDLDITLQTMLGPKHLDPYTTYIDPETLKRFEIETSGNFVGIGIQIRKDAARDMLQVVTPIKDSPAYRTAPLNADPDQVGGKGLKAGDIITQITLLVDDKGHTLDEPKVISTKGLPLADAVKKILGLAGTKVKLTVEREGVNKPLEFEIRRGRVNVETVLGVKRKKDDSWDYVIDPKDRICYVRLTSFADGTADDLKNALRQMLKTGGIRGFVLDLRYNPGGLLTSAVEISDIFIDDGLIVTIKNRSGREAAYTGQTEGSLLGFPMVVLINGGSASGSEIVASCLQDQGRAYLIGERSYGKGLVQNLQKFEGGKLKFTTAIYLRPSGKNIQRPTNAKDTDEWGVMPNEVVKFNRKEREGLIEAQHDQEVIPRQDLPPKETKPEFQDTQLDAALKYLHKMIDKEVTQASQKQAG